MTGREGLILTAGVALGMAMAVACFAIAAAIRRHRDAEDFFTLRHPDRPTWDETPLDLPMMITVIDNGGPIQN